MQPRPEIERPSRLPRFRRAAQPPAFRVTDYDVDIIRHLARHRFLRSTHIAVLVGRSLDRANDRLSKLYHACYVDRPRAQLDYHPTGGTSPFVYALADRGARLLIELDGVKFANVGWSRKNRKAGRPLIEHQLEIVDFDVSLRCAARERPDVRLVSPNELASDSPARARNPFAMRVTLTDKGVRREIGVVPDFAFGLEIAGAGRRNYLVEIDRGKMPVVRRDFSQTSFERKMRSYLAAHAARRHERQLGWKTFRVLTVTTDARRVQSMMEALKTAHLPHGAGGSLFLFATRDELRARDPLAHVWRDGNGRDVRLT